MFRRLTALLLQAALLALPASSARADCTGDHGAMMDMHEMSGMTMPDGGADSGRHQCPSGVAAECAAMVVCSATFMVVDPMPVATSMPLRTTAALQFPRDPLSVTRAPEPPPPRA